ncbi:MAG: hypothetical protein HJJLKODD_01879 [Phycisphaerae bacterium]|nr:hypothetical protein [Phycisphaerae bacterium]
MKKLVDISKLPRIVVYVMIATPALLLIPPAIIAKARVSKSTQPRIHLIQDMDNQPKFKTQAYNPLFADHRAMRRPVAGTVARGDLREDSHYYAGKVKREWATTFPMPVTESFLIRGQERYGIYCAPCHGLAGYGNGAVAARADQLQINGAEGMNWVPPLSYHEQQVRERPVGHLFNTITNGIRTMPAYGPQIPVDDRWAIVAYVRALQRSQNAKIEDVPTELRDALR